MATYLPLKPGCSFHPFHNGSAAQDYILCTPDNRQFRISASAYEILRDLEAGKSLEDIHQSIGGSEAISFAEFQQLLVTQYQAILLCAPVQPGSAGSRPRMRLLLHHTLIPQAIVTHISGLLAGAYRPFTAIAFIFLIAAAHFVLYTRWTHGPGTQFHASLALLATFFSVVIHEFGHSSAVARFGGRPGSIGVGLYILLPVLYADVSQVWRFRQKHRVVVDLGGIYFQQIVFAVLAFMAVALRNPSLRAACISIDVMTLIAANPIFRFDGYWVLVDWLGMPNLHQQAGKYLKQTAKSLLRLRWETPQHASLTHAYFKTVVFIFYSVAGNLFLVFLLLLNVRWIQATVVGLMRHAPAIWRQVQAAMTHHELLRTADLLTSLLLLLASGVTILCALWFRSREMLSIGPKHSS